MPEGSTTHRLLDEAERAAIAGDFGSADELLRSAARLQEAELGPRHPDLASTLSNLAIVAEKTGRPNEAEQFYRRAAAIASASLPPDHPTVGDTRKNLEDFCRERGLPVTAAAPSSTSRRTLPWLAALVLAAVIGGALFITRSAPSPEEPAPISTTPPPPPKVAEPPPPVETAPVEKTAPPKATQSAGGGRTTPGSPRAAATLPRVSLASAQLCQTFSTTGPQWRCDPPDEPAARGRMVLLTRVKSPRDATVVHRWYREGALQQSVSLPTRASAVEGYRTYSRQSINTAGRWRVEVRSASGDLLFEKSFAVR